LADDPRQKDTDAGVIQTLRVPAPSDLTPYIDRVRENMRGAVALGILGLLILEVILGTYYIADIVRSGKPENAKIIGDWLTTVITATMALLGAVTGFYYGTKAGGS
jgi:hypothetical protein